MTAQASCSSPLTPREKFERGIYSIKCVPRILQVDCTGVYVHENGPYQDEIKSLEVMDWHEKNHLTPKLNGKSYGDFYLSIGLISSKHFDTRDQLDTLFSKEYKSKLQVTTVDRISLADALQKLTVALSCNMEYYLKNRDEMEKDLGRKVEYLNVNKDYVMRSLKAELLHNQTIKIFGEENEDGDDVAEECEMTLIFREFHLLFSDGNYKIATARRGGYYFLFFYNTS